MRTGRAGSTLGPGITHKPSSGSLVQRFTVTLKDKQCYLELNVQGFILLLYTHKGKGEHT